MASWKEYRDIRGLCEAARYGRLEDVKQCLQYGVDVNGKDWDGNTPLNVALMRGDSQIVQFLVSNGAKYDIDGLIEAANNGRLEDVKLHLQNGVDVNGKNRYGDTPLNAALRRGHSQIVQFLVSKGARYNIDGLVSAARDGRLEDVKQHLQNGVDVNGRDENNHSPLYWATQNGYSEVIEILISKGAKRHTYNIDGLVNAASDGRLEDFKQHLQNGVDVNGRDKYGNTPLNAALRRGHSQIAQFLVSKGARYNIDGLVSAASDGRLEDVKQHLQNGVDVNGINKNDDTPLYCATRNGYSEVIEILISKGAKRHTYNIDGLVDAASNGRLEDVKQHLQNGVDVNGKARNGGTPLYFAVHFNHSKVSEYLISKGADRNIDGRTTRIVRNAFSDYEKNKRKTIAVLQKCINKAKNQKGRVTVRFIKILFTGSGAAGKTSFSNLLMKSKFIGFHHSTNIVHAKHAVSVKKAFAVGSNKSHDQSVIWLKVDDNSQINHLRVILLSLTSSSLPKLEINSTLKSRPHNQLPELSEVQSSNPSNDQSLATQESSVKQQFVTHQASSVAKRVTWLFQGSVKSEKMTCFSGLVQSDIDSSTTEQYLHPSGKVFDIITLLDTGGQPEYIHLLPTINIYPMVNFVVHDLSKKLEDQVLVEYSEDGKYIFEPYHLKYSNIDMIKFLMSSINDSLERLSSQVPQLVTIPGKDNRSYLCCVGTHADKVGADAIQNIDKQLTAMVEKLDCKAAIWENKDGGVVFPVDNTTAGDDNKEDPIANYIRSEIDKLAKDKDVYELPITWMLFELEIRQVCTSSGKAYISFRECCSIALDANLIPDMEEVKNALIYHHLLGVLLYYPEVPGLCDYVIIDHQWLFDRISRIVCLTFKQSSDKFAKINLKYNGILSKELIQGLHLEEELKEEYFIGLLVEMKIIARLPREDGSGDDFFIPYILPTQPECDDVLSQYGCLQGEPLLIQFASNLLPRGFFCCLVVHVLQQLPKGWGRLCSEKDTHHTYSNLITFRLQGAYSLSLMDKLSYLEVQIRHLQKDYYHQHPIHLKIQELLINALEVVCEQLTFNHGRLQYGFHCQCGKYDDDHIAMLTRLAPPFDYALCRYGSIVPTVLGNGHTVWLTEEVYQIKIAENSAASSKLEHSHLSGQQSIEYKLFTEYHNKLVDTLPASNLSHYFVSDKIISLEDHERIIKSTIQQDAAKLLLERVSLQLQKGKVNVFSKMLLIMDHYGVRTAQTISVEIRNKLSAVKCAKGSLSPIPEAAPAVAEATAQPTKECYSAEYELFIQYFNQIVCCISAKTLSPHFVSENIISPEDDLEICNFTSHIKAAGLLLCKICYPIRAGITDMLYKFLDIVEQHGSINDKTVTTAIRKKLKCKDKGIKDDALKDDDLPDAAVAEGPKTISQ